MVIAVASEENSNTSDKWWKECLAVLSDQNSYSLSKWWKQ